VVIPVIIPASVRRRPRDAVLQPVRGTLGDDDEMDAGRFRIFCLYATYLHEGWRLEDHYPDGAIRAFKSGEGTAKVKAFRDEMRSLLGSDPSEAQLEEALGPFGTFRPQDVEGRTRMWRSQSDSGLST